MDISNNYISFVTFWHCRIPVNRLFVFFLMHKTLDLIGSFENLDVYLENLRCFKYQKENKQPIHWNLAVPKSYKGNVIIGDVHRAKRISCDFDNEKSLIKSKYIKAGYPTRFVTSVINTCTVEKEDPIIPPQMFDERKTVYFQLPFCKTN